MKKQLLFIVYFMLSLNSIAQKPEFNLDYHAFLDNREYFNELQNPQTIFGFRLAPYIQYQKEKEHTFVVGVNMLYEFGSGIKNSSFMPTAYYHFNKNNIELMLGAFPRIGTTDNYPAIQLYDTINYYKPNIEGLLIKYGTQKNFAKAFLDWSSRQDINSREQFFAGLIAKVQYKQVFLQNYFLMFHNAGTKSNLPDEVLIDNLSNVAGIGLDLSNKFNLVDSLTISTNFAYGFERKRALNELKKPKGFISYFYVQKKWAALKNTFYRGEPFEQMNGDHFYRSKKYNRTDFILFPFRKEKLSGSFIWSIHLIGNDLDNQQAFQIRYSL